MFSFSNGFDALVASEVTEGVILTFPDGIGIYGSGIVGMAIGAVYKCAGIVGNSVGTNVAAATLIFSPVSIAIAPAFFFFFLFFFFFRFFFSGTSVTSCPAPAISAESAAASAARVSLDLSGVSA